MEDLQRPDGLHAAIKATRGFFELDYTVMNSKRPGETVWGSNPYPGYRVLVSPANNRHGISTVVLTRFGYAAILAPSGKYDSPGAERFQATMQLGELSPILEPTAKALMSASTWGYANEAVSRRLFSCGKKLYDLSVHARLHQGAIDWLHCDNDVEEREHIRQLVAALLAPEQANYSLDMLVQRVA